MNGPWLGKVIVLFGPTFTCDLDFVQTGTDLGVSGSVIMASGFGDPTTDTSYEFCVFDSNSFDPVTNAVQLLFGARLAAGSEWKQTGTGFRFKSSDKLKARFKAGDVGKGKIVLKAKGPAHVVQYLPPLDIPVTVYLRTADGVLPEACFAESYVAPFKSTTTQYRALTPEP